MIGAYRRRERQEQAQRVREEAARKPELDPKDARIVELMAENEQLRAENAELQATLNRETEPKQDAAAPVLPLEEARSARAGKRS